MSTKINSSFQKYTKPGDHTRQTTNCSSQTSNCSSQFVVTVDVLVSDHPWDQIDYIASHCTISYGIVLHCIASYCTISYDILLHCIALHCTISYGIVLHCIAPYCTISYCIVFNCIAPYYLTIIARKRA